MKTITITKTEQMAIEKAIRWYISDAQRENAPQIEIDAFKKLKQVILMQNGND